MRLLHSVGLALGVSQYQIILNKRLSWGGLNQGSARWSRHNNNLLHLSSVLHILHSLSHVVYVLCRKLIQWRGPILYLNLNLIPRFCAIKTFCIWRRKMVFTRMFIVTNWWFHCCWFDDTTGNAGSDHPGRFHCYELSSNSFAPGNKPSHWEWISNYRDYGGKNCCFLQSKLTFGKIFRLWAF